MVDVTHPVTTKMVDVTPPFDAVQFNQCLVVYSDGVN